MRKEDRGVVGYGRVTGQLGVVLSGCVSARNLKTLLVRPILRNSLAACWPELAATKSKVVLADVIRNVTCGRVLMT